jgi:hypothetical protein
MMMIMIASNKRDFRLQTENRCELRYLGYDAAKGQSSSGINNLEFKNLGFLTPEDRTERLSQNVGKNYDHLLRKSPQKHSSQPVTRLQMH